MHNQDRHTGYFELTEELLLQNKGSGKSSGQQGKCAHVSLHVQPPA